MVYNRDTIYHFTICWHTELFDFGTFIGQYWQANVIGIKIYLIIALIFSKFKCQKLHHSNSIYLPFIIFIPLSWNINEWLLYNYLYVIEKIK